MTKKLLIYDVRQIFMCMTKKTKHIIVRITEAQFTRLADVIITEQKNKSIVIRDALDNYMDGTEGRIKKQNQCNNKTT